MSNGQVKLLAVFLLGDPLSDWFARCRGGCHVSPRLSVDSCRHFVQIDGLFRPG